MSNVEYSFGFKVGASVPLPPDRRERRLNIHRCVCVSRPRLANSDKFNNRRRTVQRPAPLILAIERPRETRVVTHQDILREREREREREEVFC